ncbi:MAG TPA: hypothetical protein DDW90_08560 [Cyanobacteria bacterium UBA9971]|nr:hypothetical protein [Cyanobacteria bacterium UBA9971]
MSLNIANYQGLNENFNKKPLTANDSVLNASSALSNSRIKRTGNLYSLSFTGNPNHILLISAECRPFAKTGGMGDVNCELPGEYNEKNNGSKGKDEIRTMIPLYNSEGGPVEKDGKLYFVHSGGKEFPLEKTGIEADFTYGSNKSKAVLYKSENPENGVMTYFVHSPEISKDKKEYTDPYSNMYGTYSAFSSACVALLNGLNKKENFDVGVLHTTDWHTAFAINNLHEAQKKDDSLKDIKTVHTFHNAGYIYQGAVEPLRAVVNNFGNKDISKVLHDNRIQTELEKLGAEKSLKGLRNLLDDKEQNPENYAEPETRKSINKINRRIIKVCQDHPWDKYGNYNPSRQAIKEADLLTTVSNGFMEEMMSSDKIAPVIRPDLKRNEHKTVGIVNGLEPGGFDPAKVKFPFNTFDFAEQKMQNKLYLQEDLSLNGNKESLMSGKKAPVEGYLEKDPDKMLCFLASRFDTGQKGIDMLMKSAEKFLAKNENIQLIIGAPIPAKDENSALVTNFRKNVIEKYPGRVVVIKEYLPIPQFMAGADAFFVPSRWEPCGLMQLQAMRMGAIPIVSNTGGLKDTITSIQENPNKATGFKTSNNLFFMNNPEDELARVVGEAYKTFSSDKNTWNKMVKNALTYDSSWNKAVGQYYNRVYHNPIIDKSQIKTGENLVCSA